MGSISYYTYLDSEIVDAGFVNTWLKRTAPNYQPSPNNVIKYKTWQKLCNTWTTYQVLPQLTVGVGVLGMDKVYGDAANTKYAPGYARYDAMARYNVNKNVDLQLNVNNL